MKILIFAAWVLMAGSSPSWAEEGHHQDEAHHEENGDHDDHAGHESHDEEGHEDEHGHGAAANLGEGNAVEEYHEDEGRLRLGDKAIQRLGLKWGRPEHKEGEWLLPETAVLSVRGSDYVYLTDGKRWFWTQRVSARAVGDGKVAVQGLKSPDQVVTHGVNFIRIAELDLQAGESAGHGH